MAARARRRPAVVPALVAGALATGAIAACGGASPSITVFAAASLTDALTEIAETYEAAHPGVDVELSFAGSSSLREQVLAGAPADVFASADAATVEPLVAAGLVAAGPDPFATARVVVAVPAGNPGEVRGLADLARPELLVGLCAPEVPCGRLAADALARAGVEPSLDTLEPDVRSLLTKLAAGELDAGIVYETDVAAAAGDVTGIDMPEEARAATTYVVAVLDGAGPEAADLAAFLRSPPAQAILADHGFGVP